MKKRILLLISALLLIVFTNTITFADDSQLENMAESYEDDKVKISITEDYEYLYVYSQDENAVISTTVIDGEEMKVKHRGEVMDLYPFGTGYHDVEVVLSEKDTKQICYEKEFGIVVPVAYEVSYEDTLQKMKEEYPILKEKLKSIEIAEEENDIKAYEGMDGNHYAVLYMTIDSTEEEFEKLLKSAVIELAFENLPADKKKEIAEILDTVITDDNVSSDSVNEEEALVNEIVTEIKSKCALTDGKDDYIKEDFMIGDEEEGFMGTVYRNLETKMVEKIEAVKRQSRYVSLSIKMYFDNNKIYYYSEKGDIVGSPQDTECYFDNGKLVEYESIYKNKTIEKKEVEILAAISKDWEQIFGSEYVG